MLRKKCSAQMLRKNCAALMLRGKWVDFHRWFSRPVAGFSIFVDGSPDPLPETQFSSMVFPTRAGNSIFIDGFPDPSPEAKFSSMVLPTRCRKLNFHRWCSRPVPETQFSSMAFLTRRVGKIVKNFGAASMDAGSVSCVRAPLLACMLVAQMVGYKWPAEA